MICFVGNGCWARFGGFLGILGGIIGGIGLIILLAKLGVLASMGAAVARCLCAGGARDSGSRGGKGQLDAAEEGRGRGGAKAAAGAGAYSGGGLYRHAGPGARHGGGRRAGGTGAYAPAAGPASWRAPRAPHKQRARRGPSSEAEGWASTTSLDDSASEFAQHGRERPRERGPHEARARGRSDGPGSRWGRGELGRESSRSLLQAPGAAATQQDVWARWRSTGRRGPQGPSLSDAQSGIGYTTRPQHVRRQPWEGGLRGQHRPPGSAGRAAQPRGEGWPMGEGYGARGMHANPLFADR